MNIYFLFLFIYLNKNISIQIVLTDLHNPTRAYFAICNKWLAKNKDDGQISREFILINKSANRIARSNNSF